MNRSRVTGDLASHGNIFVDIANDRVGIGSTIPAHKLEVRGDTHIYGDLEVESSLGYIRLTDSNSSFDDFGLRNDNGVFFIRDVTNGANRFSINSEGTLRALNRMDFDAGIHLNAGDLRIVDTIKHRDDENTKIRFPANDTFTVETGGSERFRVDPNGRVTIGIGASAVDNVFLTIPRLQSTGDAIRLISQRNDTAPADLSFVKSRSTTYGSYTGAQDDDFVMAINSYIDTGSALSYRGTFRSIFDTSTGGVHFQWGSGTSPSTTGEKMRLTATGNLGIGTDLPSQKLHIEHDSFHQILLKRVGSGPSEAIFANAGNYTDIKNNASGIKFSVGSTPESKMVVRSVGVGIGTQLPRADFHIEDNNPSLIFSESDAAADNKYWRATVNGQTWTWDGLNDSLTSGNNNFRMTRSGNEITAFQGRVSGSTWFNVSNSTQRVGIGTDNPTFELDLRTTGQADLLIGSYNAGGARLMLDGDSNGDGSGGDFCEIMADTGGDLTINARNPASDAEMIFKTGGGTERLRIKSNGQIILGSDGTNSELTFSQDGTSGVILNSTTTGFGGYNTFTVNSAAFVHKYGSNDRMTIDSSGRLLLGSSFSSNVNTFKYSIKESSNENAAILFLDSDNMRGGICGTTKGNDELITGTGNMDFVVGSLYSDTFIIGGQSGNQNGAIRMKISANTGHVLIGPNAASEHNPSGNLDIVGDNNSNGPELYLRVSNNNTTDNIGALLFGNNVDKSIVKIQGVTHTANNTGDIAFHTSTAGTMTEKLRVTSAGALGLNGTNYGTAGQVLTSQGSGQPVEWRTIVQAPVISSITGNIFAGSSGQTLTLAGQHFGSATGVVNFKQTSDGVDVNVNVTPSSDTALTVTIPSSVGNNVTAGNAVTVKFTNSAGLIGSGTNTTVLALPSGGSITTSGNFRIHTFTSSGNFVLTKSTTIEYLVVAGGGGGGGNDGGHDFSGGSGGGGAGGYRTGSVTPSASTHTITVGGGGSGNLNQFAGSNGSNSAFGSIVSTGGGGGGGVNNAGSNGQSGGSGGGSGNDDSSTTFNGGSGTSGQGNAGGGSDQSGGGGGGGAGGAGGAGVGHQGGNGGAGASSSITGSAVTRAGGGGGGNGASANQSSGGSGGGGVGAVRSSSDATAGSTNTGSGGGGAADSNVASEANGANGGSGIVILRYNVTNL